ncbi:MAG: DeoR/GlpR transcriptional regulator [Alphaproteobacteria bacterium HGW-Alphaproteobacteria-1]|jgi:DeoR family glycerol-3-phosphate regulon repressor|nr:MAG: DeoR/GlpR transcriptional regulator [Alphaproteobacteria bacterium HGW-Alphaproteobacteria-1]
MTKTSRQQQILAALETSGRASISDLAEQFEVSDETIRRDLKILSAEGLVEKFHGGVRLSLPRSELSFDRRLREQAKAKTAIAARAARHLSDGATVLLDNSTTACFLARELVHREPMTFLTISLEIAGILSGHGCRHRVILPGGELRNADRTITGIDAIQFLSRFTPGYFVTSMVAGSGRGCHDFDVFEAEFKRRMLPLADQTMVLMDSSKFGKSGLIHVCDWAEIDVLVTDAAPPEVLEGFDHGDLLLAEPSAAMAA